MLFTSVDFLVFLPIVLILYFLTPASYRWIVNLLASYYFYLSFRADYLLIIIASTLVDYAVAIKMAGTESGRKRRWWLIGSFVTNLGLLGTFKYFNFLTHSANNLIEYLQIPVLNLPCHDWLLPVGISFYTFQTLSYTIDVYRGDISPERHLGKFAVFVAFWPQLVAGPIERAGNLLPRLSASYSFDSRRVIYGINQMLFGFFKKLVVADRLAVYVNEVYADPGQYTTIPLVIATIFFAFQIYCDFSGYSDIAIGCARIMGIELTENFRRPYLATSVSEFWRRWHITLATWFRDYVYIPLGGNQRHSARVFANLMITFLLSGLWHGAGWNFLIWGGLNGIFLIGEKILDMRLASLKLIPRSIKWLYTFSVICLGWVFFRSETLQEAWLVLENIFALNLKTNFVRLFAFHGPFNFFLSLAGIGLLILSYSLPVKLRFSTPKSVAFVSVCLFLIILLGEDGSKEFIYFQF